MRPQPRRLPARAGLRSMAVFVSEARWPDDRELVATLFGEYVRSLAEDISFQDVATELAQLPGKYARPDGLVLIARRAEPAGIAAYRAHAPGICEMKRLYVRPAFRGTGVARRLVTELLQEARTSGYRTIVLDTLASMRSARALYGAFGFRPIAPYYDNPLPGVTFMALDL